MTSEFRVLCAGVAVATATMTASVPLTAQSQLFR
jgi:hypothetical protein